MCRSTFAGSAPTPGAGYQASRTVPLSATVASPWPQAAVMGIRLSGRDTLGRLALVPALDPSLPTVELTRALVDIESVSGDEAAIADAVAAALDPFRHLELIRDGDAVVARTNLGRDRRVVIAGHLDTVP